MCSKTYRLVEKSTTHMLRTKEMLNSVLSSVPKEAKNSPSIHPD